MRVYLETTIFNRYLEEGRSYNEDTKALFAEIKSGGIEAFTSTTVIDELSEAPEPKRSQMIALVKDFNITVLQTNKEAQDLAEIYVETGIIPARFRLDGTHIAITAIFDLDCIVSLNFHHINKLKTKIATEVINRARGYSSPYICTPLEVTGDDE